MSISRALLGRTIVLHSALLRLCSASKSPYETAALLERLLYFQGIKEERGEDPWVYDSRETLCDELHFSERQLRNGLEFLKDAALLSTDRRLIDYQGKPRTITHFLIDRPRVERLLKESSVNLTDAERQNRTAHVGQTDRPTSVKLTEPDSRKTSDVIRGSSESNSESDSEKEQARADAPAPPSISERTRGRKRTASDALTDHGAQSKGGTGKANATALPDVPPALLAFEGFETAWGDWAAHRRERRKPLTPTSVKKQFKMLLEQPDPVAVLELAVEKGWDGLWPLKPGDVRHGKPTTTAQADDRARDRFSSLMDSLGGMDE